MVGKSRFSPVARGSAAVLLTLAVYLVPDGAAAGTALAFGALSKDAVGAAARPVINASIVVHDYKIEDIPLYIANLNDPDPRVRREAAAALSYLKDDSKRVVQALERAFRDPEFEVRRAAIRGLVEKTAVEGEVSPYLLSALADPNEWVRWDAVALVAKQRVPTVLAAPLLLDVFDTDAHVRVRQMALRTLIEMAPNDIAVRDAVIAGFDDFDGYKRALTVFEYSKLAEHEDQPLADLLPVIVGLLGDDPEAVVRAQTAWTLRSWAEANRKRGWAPPPAGAALVAALYDNHPNVRRDAAAALAYYPTAPAAHGGIQRLYDLLEDPDMNVRTSATRALVRPSDNQAAVVQSLLANASSADKNLRTVSYLALARLAPDDGAVYPLLTSALLNEEGYTRSQVVEALGLMGLRARHTVPDLTALYFDEKYIHQSRLVVVLARIGAFDAQVQRVFAAALGSSVVQRRRAAVENLLKFGAAAASLTPQVRPPARRSLSGDSRGRRRRSARPRRRVSHPRYPKSD